MRIKLSSEGKAVIEQARQKKFWNRQAVAWYGDVCALTTLKRFRLGQPVDQDYFQKLCNRVGVNWEDVVDRASTIQPEDEREHLESWWAGRRELITTLLPRLQGNCRVLILTGITGLGKTALGNRLAAEFTQQWHKSTINLDPDKDNPPPFASVADRLLSEWQDPPTPDDRKDPAQLMNLLLRKLRQGHYLVQIDSLEILLEGDEDTGWNNFRDSWWQQFFLRLLAEPKCESRLILTSQVHPTQVDELRYQQVYHCERLTGLNLAEQQELFSKAGLDIGAGSGYLERIGAAYEGHPLALQTIAGEILSSPFNGNITAYWQQYSQEIIEVERTQRQGGSGKDELNLHGYTRNLRRQVKLRVERSLERLKQEMPDAYLLLCEGAVYRNPVPPDWWLSHLEDLHGFDLERQELALDSLRDRCLVEEYIEANQVVLRLHNLIRSAALEHLQRLKPLP